MKLSKKAVEAMGIDTLMEVLINNMTYYIHTDSKIRLENINLIEQEIKRRINLR